MYCYHSFSHAIHFSSHLYPSSATAFPLDPPAFALIFPPPLNPPRILTHISTVTTRFSLPFYFHHFHLLHQTPRFPSPTSTTQPTLHCMLFRLITLGV